MAEEIKNKLIQLFLFIAFSVNPLIAQPDNRFDLFDWEMYSQPGRINSISEDNTYFYFGTENAGILRFNKFSEQFDIPITRAQGLHSKSVKHVYFDEYTGILWVVGDKFIEYSFSKTGGWQKSALTKARILDIGSSNNYLWLRSGPNFTKLDHINGVNLGTYSSPDESNVNWGDVSYNYMNLINFDFNDYFVEDAWLLTINGASDSRGEFLKYKSYYKSEHKFSWIGLDNGALLQIDKFSKSIKPIFHGLGTNLIRDGLVDGDFLWIVGEEGITKFDMTQNTSEVLRPEEYFQFDGRAISSLLKVGNKFWFGLNGYILIYNTKKDSFTRFRSESMITDLALKDDKVWISNVRYGVGDIFAIDIESKTKLEEEIPNVPNQDWNEILVMRYNAKSKGIEAAFYKDKKVYFSNENGIYNDSVRPSNLTVNSSLYFNGAVNDILVLEEFMFIATERGLFVADLRSKKLLEHYDFLFLRDIIEINYFSDFLVLLTKDGLVKFNMEL